MRYGSMKLGILTGKQYPREEKDDQSICFYIYKKPKMQGQRKHQSNKPTVWTGIEKRTGGFIHYMFRREVIV